MTSTSHEEPIIVLVLVRVLALVLVLVLVLVILTGAIASPPPSLPEAGGVQ